MIARSRIATMGVRRFPPGASGGPSVGAHGSDFDIQDSGTSPTTVTLTTQAAGSSIVALLGGFLTGQFGTPTYNGTSMGSAIRSSVYFADKYSGYGNQIHALANISGGSGHVVSSTKSTAANESTLIAVEVKGGVTIQASSIVARDAPGAGVAYTSNSVTTTGPALLVAFWGGDGDTTTNPQTANVENGWTMVESLFVTATAYVQAAAAVKQVGAGTHTVSWTPVANQGAILALVAVQA